MSVAESLGTGLDLETRTMVLETIREYGKKNFPHSKLIELDSHNEFPKKEMADLYDPDQVACNLIMIPTKYGGLGGNSYDIYRACEELSKIDLGVCTSVFATFLGMDPIMMGGTEEQKTKWITKIAQDRCYVAYGATEAAAGSDLLHLKTKAERVMEGDKVVGYKITGGKMWITNAGVAGVFTILARAPKGVSWFVVEKGTKGLTVDKHEDKHGIRLSDTCPVNLQDVYVPIENLIGGVEGKGLRQAQAVFGYTRLMVAAMALGTGWKAIEHAVRYSQQRKVGGQPLCTKQGMTHKLIVPFAARLEAARAFVEEVARRIDGERKACRPRAPSPRCSPPTPPTWPATTRSRPTAATATCASSPSRSSSATSRSPASTREPRRFSSSRPSASAGRPTSTPKASTTTSWPRSSTRCTRRARRSARTRRPSPCARCRRCSRPATTRSSPPTSWPTPSSAS
ncbi:MAG: acyl-CoA dehydrogenase family protein [Elusimicrobiota bacterium]|nr:MAG: acyl-CoA dehydrogenase family protein [Elusimicrobiota bacterium]